MIFLKLINCRVKVDAMEQFSWLDFLLVSIPEQFLMALMVWAILGKKESIKIYKTIICGLILACSFEGIYLLTNQNVVLLTLAQVITFILVVYFIYDLNYIEAIIGTLLTTLIFMLVQATIINVGYVITGIKYTELSTGNIQKILFVIPEYILVCPLSFILYIKNIKLLNFKKKKMDRVSIKKVRYLVLQLTFIFLLLLINYRVFLYNLNKFDKSLIIMSFLIVIVFTILVVQSAFKVGESIQKEEELKRKIDGIEIIQNIDYLNTLIDKEEYDEVKTILKSFKNDVDKGMVNSKLTSRGS